MARTAKDKEMAAEVAENLKNIPEAIPYDPWDEAARLERIALSVPRLKAPFEPHQTKLGQIQDNGFQGTIVEWNYVADRLDAIDPSWSQHTETKYHGPIGNKMVVEATCTLIVLGVQRTGHSADAATADQLGNAAKRVDTDAFKRAAAKHGVARYLYAGDSKAEAAMFLTEAQVAAVVNLVPTDRVPNEWASDLLGRTVNLQVGEFTAHEVDILFAAGGKG